VPDPNSYPQTFFQPPPGACQIVLVRHGQSAPFVEGRPFDLVDGQGDPPLSPLGRWQAEQVGARLADEPIDAIYATSLQRTVQTATPLAEAKALEIQIEPDLREVFLGEGEGGHFRKMSAEGHPAALAMREKLEWGEIPGAETNAQFAGRCVPALERIAERHPDQLVVVFAHGGTIGALLAHALGVNMFKMMGSRNSAISMVVVDGPHWIVRAFNDGAHAGPLTADAEPPT
jgi:probable phosphoglycerate mutase